MILGSVVWRGFGGEQGFSVLIAQWTTDDNGELWADLPECWIERHRVIHYLTTRPSADFPPTAYAVQIRNNRGTDLLRGKGAGRSATAIETVPIAADLQDGTGIGGISPTFSVALEITGAGAGGAGTLALYGADRLLRIS